MLLLPCQAGLPLSCISHGKHRRVRRQCRTVTIPCALHSGLCLAADLMRLIQEQISRRIELAASMAFTKDIVCLSPAVFLAKPIK